MTDPYHHGESLLPFVPPVAPVHRASAARREATVRLVRTCAGAHRRFWLTPVEDWNWRRETELRKRCAWRDRTDDRAPLRTIVTDLDRAQVPFEVGDDVVFTARDGSTKPGTIEKINPKRARVRCAQQRWDVPYVVLWRRDEPDRDRGGERLGEVAQEGHGPAWKAVATRCGDANPTGFRPDHGLGTHIT